MGWGSPEGEAAPAGRQSGKEGRDTPKHTQTHTSRQTDM